MSIMLLAVDIGNTNITFGLFRGKSIESTFNIPTCLYSIKKLKSNLKNNKIKETIVCSVVPRLTRRLSEDLKTIADKKPYIIGKSIKVPIKNLYRNPGQVGQDRLVNAFAAISFYCAPAIVVDFGTAITFDIISKRKEYLGGMILPGLKISLEALNKRTALLPKVSLKKPNGFIGRDTRNSMLSGIIYGFSSLTDDLITRIKKRIGKDALAIATGGNINLISKYCREIDKIDPFLTLKGLNRLYAMKKNT